MAEEKSLEGLGGWLILVGIGIILAPVRTFISLYPDYKKLFSDGSWTILTTPGTAAYHPLWAPFISGEIIINSLLVIAWIFIAALYFSKKKAFPKWFIGVSVFTLCFIFIDALAVKAILPDKPLFDAETAREIGRSLISVLIWVPYMLNSKRVKATFVQ